MPLPAPIPDSYRVPHSGVVAGEYPGARDSAQAREKISALLDAGITVFIDLTTRGDRLTPYDDVLAEEARRIGVEAIRISCPIPDLGIERPEIINGILDLLDRYAAEGRTSYVHCWGGAGRTGLIVGCLLVRHGLDGPAALAAVRSLFATMSPEKVQRHAGISPQTEAQCHTVSTWSEHDRLRHALTMQQRRIDHTS